MREVVFLSLIGLLPIIYSSSGSECVFSNEITNVYEFLPEISVEERIDCHPEPNSTRSSCEARGCVFSPVQQQGAPWCHYPLGYGYIMKGDPTETSNGFIIHLQRTPHPPMFGGEHSDLWLHVEMQNEHRLRLLFSDRNPSRFKVPIDIPCSTEGRPAEPAYKIQFTASPTFGIKVLRRATGELILDTSLPGFVYSDQFIQLPIRLPLDSTLYGWGENEQSTFAMDMNWHQRALYARDQPPSGTLNMYGVHPRLTVLDKNGDAAGILFLNSAAQELAVTPMPGAIYRTIGGLLDMYIFLGPSPENVVEQYTQAIGRSPLPPYWSLGFHLCRFGYKTLENMQAARKRMDEFEIPQDAQWGDIDIMRKQLDFTVDPERFGGLPKYVDQLKEQGVKFVTILDPCISTGERPCTYKPFDLGQKMDVWVKRADGSSPLVGRVWPNDPVYFADYTNPRTHEWWKLLIKDFHKLIAFDGLWIDMNEPSNFAIGDLKQGCANNKINFPPYTPHIGPQNQFFQLSDKTVCADAVHALGLHYDVHNLYGWSQSRPTLEGVREATGKRGLVLSRSTFVGSGQWVAHWLGDNFSNWSNLKNSIIGMLQFNQFGIPFVGADICGFIGNTTEELCARWQQLGAFYPFSRNHNSDTSKDQDPGIFGSVVARITRNALHIRYSLLPYLYTLFYQHNTKGSTVARPLWHEFPRDNSTRQIDEQFLWGSGLLISPVVHQGRIRKSLYLPPGARWYTITDFFNWSSFSPSTTGWVEVEAPLDVIPLHVRGGSVLPLQLPAMTTKLSRQNPFQLIFALDQNNQAFGSLYLDDGDSLNTIADGKYLMSRLAFQDNSIHYTLDKDGWVGGSKLVVQDIVVLGLSGPVSQVSVGGKKHVDFTFAGGRLIINKINLSIKSEWKIELA